MRGENVNHFGFDVGTQVAWPTGPSGKQKEIIK